MGRRRPEVEAKWRARLQAWQASGLGAREFGAREGLNVGSLWAWKRRLGAELKPAANVPKMVPVVVTRTPKPTTGQREVLELVLANGHSIRVPAHFDEAA